MNPLGYAFWHCYASGIACHPQPLPPMDLYDRYLLPRLVNCVCGSPMIARARTRIVPKAAGRVLEIGFGSGLNLPHYERSRIERLWALEPSAPMRALAQGRVQASGLPLEWLDLPGERIPLPDASVDCVVSTFTLCTIPGVEAALAQVRRVLRPGGRLLFCEHGAAPDAAVRRWQDQLDGLWGRFAGGCHLNREIAPLLAGAGFALQAVESAYLRGSPRLAGYLTWGEAAPT